MNMGSGIWNMNNFSLQGNNNGVTSEFGSPTMLNGGNNFWQNPNQGLFDTNGILGNPQLQPNLLETLGVNTNTPSATPDFWSLSNPDAWKAGSMGMGAFGSLVNTALGFKQHSMAKDQVKFAKEAFWLNYNEQMKDRQLADERRKSASVVSKGE